jgi:4'-phosphopantetheinyl transferase
MSESWIEPPYWPALMDDEAHVWLGHLPSARARLDDFAKWLSPEERERAARFRLQEHRERSQITRGFLRLLLARYCERDPRDLSFSSNPHGKPEVRDCDVQFNASHSGDYAAFAFTRAGVVGVDIEHIRGDMARRDEIARKHFASGEQKQLESIAESDRHRAFFDLWTCKEAFVKARGDGLFSGLDQFEILLNESRVLSVRGIEAAAWWLKSLPPIAGYSGAVVVNATACSPRFWKCAERFVFDG